MRCTRCGHQAADTDKFCAECGLFLRDAFIDHRVLHALVSASQGKQREARHTREAIDFAVRERLEVMYVTEDTVRANPDHLRVLLSAGIEAGAR
ncbi:MAG: zinc-ribbon domain-containing protein, partial [Thermoanaerobaculia bacterium]